MQVAGEPFLDLCGNRVSDRGFTVVMFVLPMMVMSLSVFGNNLHLSSLLPESEYERIAIATW